MTDKTNPYMLSDATRKALERFGPGSGLSNKQPGKPQPLPVPAADWELWAQMSKATLIEVVAVSLNLDPRAIKLPSKYSILSESIYATPGNEFDRRLKIACAHVGKTGPIKSLDFFSPEVLAYGPASATVSLPQFASWALGMGWELPDKFPRLAPVLSVPAERVGQTPAPVLSPAKSSPVVQAPAGEPQAKRRGLWDVVTPYIIETMQAGQYATAKELFNALEAKAGSDSPFDKGKGLNRYSLFVRETCEPLALKTLQNSWKKLRTDAGRK